MKLKARYEIFNEAGRILIEKGKSYTLKEKVFQKEYYGVTTGAYYPPKLLGYRLEEISGLWAANDFEIINNPHPNNP